MLLDNVAAMVMTPDDIPLKTRLNLKLDPPLSTTSLLCFRQPALRLFCVQISGIRQSEGGKVSVGCWWQQLPFSHYLQDHHPMLRWYKVLR